MRVYATSSMVHRRDFDIPGLWNLQIEFSNGATGFCFGNVDQANGYDAYHHIHGTEGGLIFDSLLDRPQKVRVWSEKTTDGKWIYPLDAERCKAEEVEEHQWPAETTTPDSGDVMKHQTGACVSHFWSVSRRASNRISALLIHLRLRIWDGRRKFRQPKDCQLIYL